MRVISREELAVFSVLKRAARPLTNDQIAEAIDVSPRTVRAATERFTRIGLCDRALTWHAHRFSISSRAGTRCEEFLQRLEMAALAFGVDL